MKHYSISGIDREQAERMAAKWAARAEAFYDPNPEGWGVGTAGYCKTDEEAEAALCLADSLNQAISGLVSGRGTWEDLQLVKRAVADRDGLDAGIEMYRNEN